MGIPSRRRACLVVGRRVGAKMEHPTAERSWLRPPDPLRLRRRRDGIPTPLVTPHYPGAGPGTIPERGPPEAPVFGLELGNPTALLWSQA